MKYYLFIHLFYLILKIKKKKIIYYKGIKI